MVIEEVVSVQEEAKVEAAPPVVVEEIKPKVESKTKTAPPAAVTEEEKTKKKAKKHKSKENAQPSAISNPIKIISDIENSQLNSSEVQQLIDVLLARQNDNEQWHKPKGDPVEVLKKQLSDIDVQLHEERKLAQGAALKNKELKNELQQERNQRQNFQQMTNRYAQQTKELEAARKQVEEKHLSEMQSTQAQITRMQQLIDGGSQREFHQLADENQHLKLAQQKSNEEKNKLINDLNQQQKSQQAMKQDYDQAIIQFKQQQEQQQKSLQDKIVQYENELQNAQKSKGDADSTLAQIKERLMGLEGINKSLEAEVSTMRVERESIQNSASAPQAEVSTLSQKLLETEAQLSQTQSSMKELLNQVEQKNQAIHNQEACHKKTQDEFEQFKNSVAQSKESENKLSVELEAVKGSLKDKETALDSLNKQNVELTAELAKSKEATAVVVDVVDSSDKDKEMEDLQKSIATLQDQVGALNKKNEELSSELAEAKISAETAASAPVLDDGKLKELEDALAGQTEQNKKLEESVETMKKKNNDLREKNWKAIDALSKVEEETKKQEKSLEKTICKSLKSVYPDMKLPKTDGGLQKFFEEFQTSCAQYTNEKESCTKSQIETLQSAYEDLQRQIEELNNNRKSDSNSEEVEKMQAENDKLKSVLRDTETLLGRLQSGIDAEVHCLQDKVESKDKEIDQLNSKVNSMEETMKEHGFEQEVLHKQVETLTSELQQEKEDRFNLSIKLNDLEQSYKEEQSDKDKVMNLESKLKAAEAKIEEFETSRNNEIENEIEDAMKASASAPGADIGTSV
eukprot:TCONS_00033525-protein